MSVDIDFMFDLDQGGSFLSDVQQNAETGSRNDAPVFAVPASASTSKPPPPSETNSKVAQHIKPDAPPASAGQKLVEEFQRINGQRILKDVDINAKGKSAATNGPLPTGNGLAVAQPAAVKAVAGGATLGAPLEQPLPAKPASSNGIGSAPPAKTKPHPASTPMSAIQGQLVRATSQYKRTDVNPGLAPSAPVVQQSQPAIQTITTPPVHATAPSPPKPKESIKNPEARDPPAAPKPEPVVADAKKESPLKKIEEEKKVVTENLVAPSEKEAEPKPTAAKKKEESPASSPLTKAKEEPSAGSDEKKSIGKKEALRAGDSDDEKKDEGSSSSSSSSESEEDSSESNPKKKKESPESAAESEQSEESSVKTKPRAKKDESSASSSEEEEEEESDASSDKRKAIKDMLDDEAEESDMDDEKEAKHKGDEEVASDEESLGSSSADERDKDEDEDESSEDPKKAEHEERIRKQDRLDAEEDKRRAKRAMMKKKNKRKEESGSEDEKKSDGDDSGQESPDVDEYESDGFLAKNDEVEYASDDGVYAPLRDADGSDAESFVKDLEKKYSRSAPKIKTVHKRLRKNSHVIEDDSDLEDLLAEEEAEKSDASINEKKKREKKRPRKEESSSSSSDESSSADDENSSDSEKKKKNKGKKARKEPARNTEEERKKNKKKEDGKNKKKKEDEKRSAPAVKKRSRTDDESSSSVVELDSSEAKKIPKPAHAKKVPLPARPTAPTGKVLSDEAIRMVLIKLVMSAAGNVLMQRSDASEKERELSYMVQDMKKYQDACAQLECSELLRENASVFRIFFGAEPRHPPAAGEVQSLNVFAVRYLDILTSAANSPIPRKVYELAKDPRSRFTLSVDEKKVGELNELTKAGKPIPKGTDMVHVKLTCEEGGGVVMDASCRFRLVTTLNLIFFALRPLSHIEELVSDYAKKTRNATVGPDGKFQPSFIHIATTGNSEMQTFSSRYDKQIQALVTRLVSSLGTIKEQVEALEAQRKQLLSPSNN
jgi:hypothetical protein